MDKKIILLGLGGAGCRILKELSAGELPEKFDLLAIDTDVGSLKDSGLPEEKCIQAARNWRKGAGCGGDVISGQRSIGNERAQIRAALTGCDILLVCGGLGGGVCTGGLPVILSEADKLHITVVALMSLPFSMEAYRRRKIADDVLEDLLPLANAVITVPNDLLFVSLPGETALGDAFKLADAEMAKSMLALAHVLCSENLFSADIAAFDNIFKRRSALCSIGVGCADMSEADPGGKAMEKLLLSPLLGGANELSTADAVIFSVTGGPELSLNTVRDAMSLASAQLPQDAAQNVLIGSGVSDAWKNKLQLTAVALRYQEPAAAQESFDFDSAPVSRSRTRRSSKSSAPSASGSQHAVQLELPVDSKGIMEGSIPVSYNGEDLDVPTFKRKGLVIDPGR